MRRSGFARGSQSLVAGAQDVLRSWRRPCPREPPPTSGAGTHRRVDLRRNRDRAWSPRGQRRRGRATAARGVVSGSSAVDRTKNLTAMNPTSSRRRSAIAASGPESMPSWSARIESSSMTPVASATTTGQAGDGVPWSPTCSPWWPASASTRRAGWSRSFSPACSPRKRRSGPSTCWPGPPAARYRQRPGGLGADHRWTDPATPLESGHIVVPLRHHHPRHRYRAAEQSPPARSRKIRANGASELVSRLVTVQTTSRPRRVAMRSRTSLVPSVATWSR